MVHRPLALAFAVGTGLAVLTGLPGERRALAQPASEAHAAAAALFEDARRLMGEGKFAEACPKLAESQRVDPGMGTLYQLSACYEAIGRTASAWVGFRDVAGLALTAGLADREKAARGKASALEPKLMRLKITMQPANAGAGIEVKRDGAVVSPALWGTPLPLDPGPHKVSATGPDKEPWEITVQLDQPGGVVNVDVPFLLDKKAGAAAPAPIAAGPQAGLPPGGAPPPESTAPPPPEEGVRVRPWQLPLGIVATVVGAAGMGTGVAFGFMAKSAYDQSNTTGGCTAGTTHCTGTTGLSERTDAVNKGNIGTGVFIAGAVVAAGGVVLWITAPSRAARVGAASLPQLGLGPNGVSLRGAW